MAGKNGRRTRAEPPKLITFQFYTASRNIGWQGTAITATQCGCDVLTQSYKLGRHMKRGGTEENIRNGGTDDLRQTQKIQRELSKIRATEDRMK